jgi:hypothetical protein
LKIGVFVDTPRSVKGFDMVICSAKNVLGEVNPPQSGYYNAMSCFGDNKTAQSNPDQVADSKKGRATRSNKRYRFIWDWLCPTNQDYQNRMYDLMEAASNIGVAGVHLYCIGFPQEEFCTCPRCSEMKKASGLSWSQWRNSVVTDFIKGAKERVKVPLSVLLPSEPYTIKERQGIDIESLAEYVDFFIGILYDKVYADVYWLEDLAFSLKTRIQKPLYIQLYAGPTQAPIRNIFSAMIAVAPYSDGIVIFTGTEDVTELQHKIAADKWCWKIAKDRNEDLYNLLERWKGLQT